MTETLKEIAGVLRRDDGGPECLKVLDDAALGRLRTDLQDAVRANEKHIHESMQEAVNHVPRLLRGPIRKMFGI